MTPTTRGAASWFAGLALTLLFLPAGRAQTPRPADLIARDDTSFDANGLMTNPIWGWQRLGHRHQDVADLCGFVGGSGLPSERPLLLRDTACTSQRRLIALNERQKPAAAGYACNQDTDEGELQGHVNWFVVSAVGVVRWDSYARGDNGPDHDFTLWLDTLPDLRDSLDAARRAQTQPEIEIEFNGDEVLGWASKSLTPWWKSLWDEAQRSDSVPDRIIGTMPAAVTGVFGLDAIHGAHPEIHPVYALALLTSEQPQGGDMVREHWAFFVRNGGSEGECSNGFLPFEDLPTDSAERVRFRFTVPWRRGATDVEAQWREGASGVIASSEAEGPLLVKQVSRGVQLAFALPRAVNRSKRTVVLGEFDLVWRGGGVATLEAKPAAAPRRRAAKRALEPGQQFAAKLGRQPREKQARALQAILSQQDSNRDAPNPLRPGGIGPPHDVALTPAALVREAPREPDPVRVCRPGGCRRLPAPQPCENSIPGCLSNVRRGVGAGSVWSPGGGVTVRAILGETRTLLVPSPWGSFPLFSVRFSVGVDRIHPPVSQAAGGATLANPSLAAVIRLPSSRLFGPYALAGVDAYVGTEGAVGASLGGGVRLRSGLPVLPFIELRRALRLGRTDYWAWQSGVLVSLF